IATYQRVDATVYQLWRQQFNHQLCAYGFCHACALGIAWLRNCRFCSLTQHAQILAHAGGAMSRLNVMIMAGGTGGHVFPALAVAEQLRERGAKLAWLGTARGIEARLVPAAAITLHFLRVEGVRGRGVTGLLKAPFLVFFAIVQALLIMRREQPDVVVGFGGFASGPGGLAARILRKPLVIHEQNAIAGTTNRLLARFAHKVLA